MCPPSEYTSLDRENAVDLQRDTQVGDRSPVRIVIKPGGLLVLTGIVAITICAIADLISTSAATRTSPADAAPSPLPAALVPNGGFEQPADGAAGQAAGWQPYGAGYTIDPTTFHQGERSIRCSATGTNEKHGALFDCTLNQTTAGPIEITGWSRAQGVDGIADSNYSLYVDAECTDGSYIYGRNAPFPVGTTGWTTRSVHIDSPKPIRRLSIYALFRGHAGVAWFDDFDVRGT
jgi:hypothetical protein